MHYFYILFVFRSVFQNPPNSVLGHIAQPRIPASGTVRVGNASLAIRGEMWLQHIWWSAVPGGAFPTWNWFNIQLSSGYNLMLMALGNATDSTEASGCLGRVGSYGNLVDPRGASAALNWSDVCIRVRDVYEDAECGVRYPVRSDIRVGARLRLVVTAEVRDSVVRQGGCKTAYFEGASRATGEHGGRAVEGRGFTEQHLSRNRGEERHGQHQGEQQAQGGRIGVEGITAGGQQGPQHLGGIPGFDEPDAGGGDQEPERIKDQATGQQHHQHGEQ